MKCVTARNLQQIDNEQQRKLDLMNDTINKLVADTPRMVSIEMYVRSIAQQAYIHGWNNRAAEGREEETA